MTSKEKAKELVGKYDTELYQTYVSDKLRLMFAKQCALICVDEITSEIRNNETMTYQEEREKKVYWNEVKQEIEKL